MQLSKTTASGNQNYPEKGLQFGEGNFLRCFVYWMFHQLNHKGSFNDSAVAVQPLEKGMVNLLNEQDGLYTVYLRSLKAGKAKSTHELIERSSHHDKIIRIASGEKAKHEKAGFRDIAIFKSGVT